MNNVIPLHEFHFDNPYEREVVYSDGKHAFRRMIQAPHTARLDELEREVLREIEGFIEVQNETRLAFAVMKGWVVE